MSFSINTISLISDKSIFASVSSGTAIIINDAAERIAYSFKPHKTMTVTDVDMLTYQVGNITGVNFKMRFETDNAGVPSGTVVGAETAAFAGVNTTGANYRPTGLQALGSSAVLTINVTYWLVLWVDSGTPDASNYIQGARYGARSNGETLRHYDGINWTNTTVVTLTGLFIVKEGVNYHGFAPNAYSISRTTRTDIFSTNKQGIKFRVGVLNTLVGISFIVTKSGSPNNLVVTVYEGSTSKYTQTMLVADIPIQATNKCYFSSPVQLAKDTDCYIVLSQESDGGSDTADYDLYIYPIDSTYINAMMPANYRFVYGTASDPTTLSVSTTEIPGLVPIIFDPETELDCAAGGGGMIVHPGFNGGMNG